MFNQRLLKSFLVGSWLLVIYAATPWSPDSTKWLAGIVLGMSYVLCGVVLGATDNAAMDEIKAAKDAVVHDRSAYVNNLLSIQAEVQRTIDECKKETNRVSKAISEMRSFQQ